jgi:hypothetical protein
MTPKTIILIILVWTTLISCNRHWVNFEQDNKIIWKKVKTEQSDSGYIVTYSECKYTHKYSNRKFEFNKYNVYESDSIRLYLRQEDSVLNLLILKEFIQCQYFFTDYESNKCNIIQWENPKKVTENGWTGYHIYITNLRELENTNMPNKFKKISNLTKEYRLSFSYTGQPFINPSVFRITISNANYNMGEKGINLNEFLNNGETIRFYQSGVEI